MVFQRSLKTFYSSSAGHEGSLNPHSLPGWNLNDLYHGIKDPTIKKDITQLEKAAENFASAFEGKVAHLTTDQFAAAIKDYESIHEGLGKLGTYAFLLFAEDNSIGDHVTFFQTIKEIINRIDVKTLFFTLEITDLSEEVLTAHFHASAQVARYKPWLTNIRLYKPYLLPKDMEKVLYEKSLVSRSNWTRLYDETFGRLQVTIDGQDHSISEALNLLSSGDELLRKKASQAFAGVLKDNIHLLSLIYNTLMKDKEIDDRWRHYARPISARNLENQVEDHVVETLIQSVKAAYPSLSHRYYALKATWLGKSRLEYWDRNAPLPQTTERIITWDEAKNIVLTAYHDFSPKMAEIGEMFFDKRWIDARLNPAKDTGAFSHPCVPSAHPYILINYHGKMRDVMTLAHELGHGIHQVLSAKQGHLLSDVPLTLAETASVFGEMLTFQSLLKQTHDPLLRKSLIAGKVEDMLNTTVRQIAFCEFERKAHEQRGQGDLTSDHLGQIWMEVQQESLGDAFTFSPEYQYYWSYISHFIMAPFYVYAYAFGDCLVNSLYAQYQQGSPGFAEKYMAMLEAGGTLRHKELLAPFNLDASDPGFWKKGLGVIESFIDQLE